MRAKKGIASFYIVAFSTLILTVVAVSFSAVIISQITKTSNDDLAQSAYDAALAGVEDAKMAYALYQNKCYGSSDSEACKKLADKMKECNGIAVPELLGRDVSEDGDVFIKEIKNGEESMQQAYSCVQVDTAMTDYRSSLTSDNTVRIIPIEGSQASKMKTVRISWYSNTKDSSELAYTNFDSAKQKVTFPSLGVTVATPPTISVGFVQTGSEFTLESFEKVEGNTTNRGSIFLVPTDKSEGASKTDNLNYIGAYNGKDNVITQTQMVKSNDHALKNLPYAVYCGSGKEFACSATLQLPQSIGGNRARIVFVISIPYGQPNTDFALEFCSNDGICHESAAIGAKTADDNSEIMSVTNMQVKIDSTGRANDLYRRLEVRMDSYDTYYPYPLYALELLGTNSNNGGYNLDKCMEYNCNTEDVTSEYGGY